MTTYKGEKFREEQISSIKKNIKSTDQMIISEDGDDFAFLKQLRTLEGNIVPMKGPGCGAVANFEYALSQAEGDIIFLSDQDDIWTDDKVVKVLKAFENPNCIMVVHDADIIDGEGRLLEESFFAIRGSKSGYWKNIWKNSYIGCCMAFRKEVLEYALPFPTKGTLHDQWLGLLAEQMGEVVFIKDKLLHYRRHEDNVSGMKHLPIIKMIYNRVSLCFSLLKRTLRGPKRYEPYTVEEVKERWKH
jgi:glycosyltransferase involved in cell wall biosynthesis